MTHGPVEIPQGAFESDLEVRDPARFQAECKQKLDSLNLCQEDRDALQLGTRGHGPEWFEARRLRIMASVFQRVSNMRPTTPCDSLLEEQMYDKPDLTDMWSIKKLAIREYEGQTGRSARYPVGLMVHPQLGFLAATPDGIVSDELILKVVCPKSETSLRSRAETGGLFYLMVENDELKLRRGHAHYSQMQAQMACCGGPAQGQGSAFQGATELLAETEVNRDGFICLTWRKCLFERPHNVDGVRLGEKSLVFRVSCLVFRHIFSLSLAFAWM